MKTYRFTEVQKNQFMKYIEDKLYKTYDVSRFNVTKDDMKDFFKTLSNDHLNTPTLIIEPDAYIKMLELVRQYPVEISWHGMVKRENQTTFRLYDILVFPQINTSVTTTTDDTEYANWLTKLIMKEDFNQSELRCHGHSHVYMDVFSSGTDDAYQQDMIKNLADDDYYLFLILNKKMEMCVILYDNVQKAIFETNDIDIIIEDTKGFDTKTSIASTIKAKCEIEKTKKNTRTNVIGTTYDSVWDDFYGIDDTPPSTYKPNYGNKKKNNKRYRGGY